MSLHIERIERDAFDTWAIRFAGNNKTFMDLIGHFHQEGVERTRWDPDAFDGTGAWIIDDSTLVRYADWFDNLKASVTVTLQQKKQAREFSLVLPYPSCEGCGEVMCDTCWETISPRKT
jgi:hypothetical protein